MQISLTSAFSLLMLLMLSSQVQEHLFLALEVLVVLSVALLAPNTREFSKAPLKVMTFYLQSKLFGEGVEVILSVQKTIAK